MGKLLELLEKLVRAIFGPGDERDTGGPEPAPQAPKAEAVVGWEGDPPYRYIDCLLYTSPSPRDLSTSRMPSSA